MKRFAIAPIACAILSGCMSEAVMTGGTPATATTEELCKILHWKRNGFDYGAEAAYAELEARGEFSVNELRGIRRGVPNIGDTEKAALCSVGYFYDDANLTATQYSTSIQYVISPGYYIYVEGGKVVGIQL